LNFLAEEGPKAKNPSTYIRFIYNRVNLEKAVIRAAAVSALSAFAHKVPALRKSIIILLQKCLTDSDDEVRERAFFYLNLLSQKGDEDII
jgi:coatomer protein complex subunit gamma